MNFTELDQNMRVYEQSLDQCIVPGMYIVARLDGRSFTKLTKETCKFEAPFDERFRNLMVDTLKYLMENSGFQIVYGFTQSDEISVLMKPDDNTFGRKVRKINTTLAGEASAYFSKELYKRMQIDIIASFDCRVCPLPNTQIVEDYFIWRQEDANRNALNGWCYWTLRKEGKSARSANATLLEKGVSFKNELLFSKGINYNDLPSWQKRGVGIWNKSYEKDGFNPITGETVKAIRNKLYVEYDLPFGQEYGAFVAAFLKKSETT